MDLKNYNIDSLIFENSQNGILVTDANKNVIKINQAFTKTTGYTSKEIIGKNPNILKSGKQHRDFYINLWATIEKEGFWQGEIWNRRKNGEIYPEWETIQIIKDDNNNPIFYFAIFSDLTQSSLQQETILHLKHYDALTDLPNRLLLLDRADYILTNAKKNNTKFAVINICINNLKKINISLGYKIGDQIIITFVNKLKNILSENIILGRFDGNVFLAIVPDIKSYNEIAFLVKNLLTKLNGPYQVANEEINITSNIGIAIYPETATSEFGLINAAKEALEIAKKIGLGKFHFYTSEYQTKTEEFLSLENKLLNAIKNNEFILYYQPQIEAVSGKISGVETLIRWQHPTLGLVNPEQFIPIAEESGLIIPLTEWVLKKSCSQKNSWNELGLPKIKMAVNISPKHFKTINFTKDINKIITSNHLDPSDLELEITESSIMENFAESSKIITELKKVGINIAIDDFGTGFSSLNYLAKLPIDKIKIDKSFVKNIATDHNMAIITNAIINLAKNLNLKVAAEGVENLDQLIILRTQNCDVIQGFYYSKPLTNDEFIKFLQHNLNIKS